MDEAGARAGAELGLTVRESGFAWLEMRPSRGSSLRLTLEVLRLLEQELLRVESLAAEGAVRLLVLATAPPHPQLVGYDLDELRSLPEDGIVAWSHESQRILRGLETLSIPTVAAIQGEWLGGAAEVALACSYRVGIRAESNRIGFPQARLGFLPSWGGTVRLPRLIGLEQALRLVLTGASLSLEDAARIGLVDRALGGGDVVQRVERFAERRIEGARDRRRQTVRRRLLDDTAPGRRFLTSRAERRYLEAAEATEASRAALDLMAETLSLPLELAFARESAAAGRLLRSDAAQGRLHSQRLTDRARARLPMGRGDFEEFAVLGAGQTGSDLAHLFAAAGAHVRLKDAPRDAVRAGVARATNRIRWEREQGQISEGQARRRAARIEGATGFGGFGTLDVVVAAASASDRSAESLLKEVEAHVTRDCLLGYHDWVMSPTAVQRDLSAPERLVGLLPSFPTERFPLLEIVPGTLTSPAAASTARRLARRAGRTAIIVSDQTPTPGTRLLALYFAEASRLLEEGATIVQVDEAAEAFGFEVGPFRRMDAIGSRRAVEMLIAVGSVLGDRADPGPTVRGLGTRAETFYQYRDGRPARPSPELPEGLSPDGEAVARLVQRRLTLALINEAALILEEGCVSDPGDLEVISILGVGFPRARGGILFFAESIGLDRVVEDLHLAARRNGARFAPAGLLRDLATTGRGFFGDAPLPPLDRDAGP